MNIVCLSGRLCQAPEIKVLPSGDKVAKITLAIWQGKDSTGFFDCIAFGKNAETIAAAQKGEQICLEGNIKERKYKRKDGSNASCFEIMIKNFSFLKSMAKEKVTPADMEEIDNLDYFATPEVKETVTKQEAIDLPDDDLPF